MRRFAFAAVLLLAFQVLPVRAQAQAAADQTAYEQRFKAWQAQYDQALQLHLRGVASSGQARDLYAAAVLWPRDDADARQGTGKPPVAGIDEPGVWMQAALDARPRDALVARFEAMGCPGANVQCDAAGALAFLQREEGDNLFVQLLAFIEAQQRGDAKAAARAWRAATQATRYDAMQIEFGGLLADAVSGLPVPPMDAAVRQALARQGRMDDDSQRIDTVLSLLVAHSLPSISVVTRYCDAAQTRDDRELWDDCKSVFSLMARDGDDLISRLIGVALMSRLTRDTPQELRWREERRQLQWLHAEAARFLPPSTGQVPLDTYLDWLLRDGEIIALQRLLEANHRPLIPPAGWTSDGATAAGSR
ncbi:hypothetical protein [Pseudoxanthomonas winnipegensis]|uniref:hypothetical protein n=1 Tax=Pseudoxanthomonas winnipegensis TaxID=2480810 RepID=UPI003F827126